LSGLLMASLSAGKSVYAIAIKLRQSGDRRSQHSIDRVCVAD
jgi:hypothetical protein